MNLYLVSYRSQYYSDSSYALAPDAGSVWRLVQNWLDERMKYSGVKVYKVELLAEPTRYPQDGAKHLVRDEGVADHKEKP